MLFWSSASVRAGEGSYSMAGAYVRVEITAYPATLGRTAAATPRFRGLGLIGPTIGGKLQSVESIQYLDSVFGPFGPDVDGFYLLLSAGVTANTYRGWDTLSPSQPSGELAITTTHNLVNGVATTITWQAVEDGLGSLPVLSDLRKMKVPIAGLWLSTAIIDLPAATYTDVHVRNLVGGVAYRTLGREPIGVIGANGLVRSYVGVMPLNLNDEVTLNVQQSSGADRLLGPFTRWQLTRVGDI